ncbi:AraC family transcriptional regulator [Thermoflavimicrobium daqui]|uniref:AraC family transcriptional regulator n=1 Tax=Thermoflavimicrobium daqui TaxID=2137476 RepID=A0A364K1Z0_9BACL|nr:AraC family transcriptional regulator [Thermoflavimicrobium daqui]
MKEVDSLQFQRQAIFYIEKYIQHDISLDKVANYMGFSSYHFHRLFQSVIGMSVTAYIRRRRLTLAAIDLIHTDCRILDIAVTYRFSTQESFTRAFQKMFQMPPGMYRKHYLQIRRRSRSMIPTSTVPKGWNVDGDWINYEVGIDHQTVHMGTASAFLKSRYDQANGYISLFQQIKAEPYRGKRIHLTGFLQAQNVEQVTLFFELEQEKNTLHFIQSQPLIGTSLWSPYLVSTVIPEKVDVIRFGLQLIGKGHVWLDSLQFKETEENILELYQKYLRSLPLAPVNLHFSGGVQNE